MTYTSVFRDQNWKEIGQMSINDYTNEVLLSSIKGIIDSVNFMLNKSPTQKNAYCIIPFTLILSQQN